MDYEEFRWALGDTITVDMLREVYEAKQPLGDGVMRKLLRDFRLYMLVGGMPQAVNEYLDTNNLSSVDEVKREIWAMCTRTWWHRCSRLLGISCSTTHGPQKAENTIMKWISFSHAGTRYGLWK